jgi:hypothetical protein
MSDSDRDEIVGEIGVERIGWDITVPPMVAGERLCAEVRQWLTG